MSDAAQTKKRRLWQLHLSTAVMLMFLAALFIWANCQSGAARRDWGAYKVLPNDVFEGGYGWPFLMLVTNPNYDKQHLINILPYRRKPIHPPFDNSTGVQETKFGRIIWTGLLANLSIAAILLIIIAHFCEWLIHRREGRRQ